MIELKNDADDNLYIQRENEDHLVIDEKVFVMAYAAMRAARDTIYVSRAALYDSGMPDAAEVVQPHILVFPRRSIFLALMATSDLAPSTIKRLLDFIETRLTSASLNPLREDAFMEGQLYIRWIRENSPHDTWEAPLLLDANSQVDIPTGVISSPDKPFDPNDPKI